ncbi:FAD-dependent oxidoreductase [Chitinophaga sp. SYP-B3965]|uniref:FAD-dependent oxidoreductase n=1 Tax=Chitinophaga sp. SYP-B3965 TaxID=2663120 RepID=UPI001299C335|nr:FAD-dependent oxidoreductase [Chitinophaga sp. SYP-B3965]MRG47960.1 FAD-dependent oxidoreductase [Chitinophaga sp. SYP-B3965]
MNLRIKLLLCLLILTSSLMAQAVRQVDICVYGGSSAGVIAAYTAKKMNKSVLIIEPGKRLGGLTSGGLGYTDIGNKYAITGISRDYYRRIGKHYGKFEQWIFEPSVAEQTFHQYVKEANLDILYQHRIISAKKENGSVTEIQLESSAGGATKVIRAKMFIDCSYEGDLLAKAGVSYTVGREANAQYGETYNGVQLLNKHQFPDGVDPYKIPGKPESGLVWGISAEPLAEKGAGDKKVQAYNFRICLSNQPDNMVPITQPEGYDPTRYELLIRLIAKHTPGDLNGFLKFDRMPNNKTDINNNNAFSTDMIGMNYNYPEADYATREKITKEHELYNKGLLYFIGHDPRMPEHLRKQMLQWGYPKDEYKEFGNWSPQMYVREARRMVGAYVMTQANCEGKEVVKDKVGMAAYTMDSHNCQRIVVNGMVKNEGDVQMGGFGPYPIAYRSIIPKAEDCKNMLVPVCLSATHIAYGSIRMEPVFMVLGQSAAVAACMAIDNKQAVQDVDVEKLQEVLRLKPLGTNATAEILVDNDDAAHVEVKGDWRRETKGAYGPSVYIAESGAKSIRFKPEVIRDGTYKIYTYVPKQPGLSATTKINISADGKTVKQVSYTAASVRVEGQTSGEWVDLGTVKLKKGSQAYVEITSEGADGVVVADAVLFIPLDQI